MDTPDVFGQENKAFDRNRNFASLAILRGLFIVDFRGKVSATKFDVCAKSIPNWRFSLNSVTSFVASGILVGKYSVGWRFARSLD